MVGSHIMINKRLHTTSHWAQQLPLVTLSIIVLNVIVAVLTRNKMETVPIEYGLVPGQLSISRLFTSNFLHDGFVHLTFNMLLLYAFGRDVERVFEKLKYLLFYLGACFAGAIAHTLVVFAALPPYYAVLPVIGASGAVAGVVGLYAVRFHRKTFHFGGMELPALFVIMCWLVFQLVLGVAGLYVDDVYGMSIKLVSWWSHLGGFAFGIAVALIGNQALHGEREYLITKARDDYEQGNLAKAAGEYETLLKYDPDNPVVYAELGRLWGILGEDLHSISYYHTAIELYICHGREQEALAVVDELKEAWPETALSIATQLRLASYLEDTGQTPQAIQAFRQIIEDNPDSAEAQISLLKIGQLQLTVLNDSSAAIITLNELVNRYPNGKCVDSAQQMLAEASGRKPNPEA